MRVAAWAVICASCLSRDSCGALALRLQGSPDGGSPYEDWLAGIDGEAKELKDARSRDPDPAVKASLASAGAELAKAAPEALSGMHVVWIGDSVSRYQYLNLAYHVIHGAPPPFEFYERAFKEPGAGGPAWNSRSYFDLWAFWYNWSSSQLQTPRSEETCDCYRKGCCDLAVENRYFSAKLSGGASAHMTYLEWYKWSFRGHWAPSDGYPIRTHCKAGACAPPNSYEIPSVEQLLRDVAVELQPRPTHIVMNRGAWGALSNASLEALFSEGRALSERRGIEFIWKTTLMTHGSVQEQQEQADMETRLARQHHWQVLDAWSAGRAGLHSYMYDAFHCKEAASAFLSWELLKML